MPYWQTRPGSPQVLPAQQGWPPLPQAAQIVPEQTIPGSVHV
jgi:hypothetical protein